MLASGQSKKWLSAICERALRPVGGAAPKLWRSGNFDGCWSGRSDLDQKSLDLAAQRIGGVAKCLRKLQHVRCGNAGLANRLLDAADIDRDVARALGDLVGVAGDLLGRLVLLLDRRRDRAGDLVDARDGLVDALDGLDRFPRRALDAGDLRRD